ncbi:MAG: 30S ribosomal protein S8 [Parcubacteria group bacterium]|nr:30S ribosomal protein S8 [Parcubacteria group bacterium]MCR4342676.1 30S ribosomal protein S8 [Patescibacteria group bacterium]
MVIDPLSDMFTRIKNAQTAGLDAVVIPYSKFKMEVAKVLLKKNFIKEINRRGKKNKKFIEVVLSYGEKNKPGISDIERISKPSRRVYIPANEIKPVRQGYGSMIISTPKGILTDNEAKRENVGGEVLCKIW